MDVLVPGQRPEVVALVVIERRLLAEALVGRVRVGVDVDVVGVEVHAGGVHDRHLASRLRPAAQKLERSAQLRRYLGSFGSPSTRSAMVLRTISSVPPPIRM